MRHNKLWKKQWHLPVQRHVLQQLWQAAAALHRLKSLLKKQRLRGRAALQRDRQRLHLPYGIMRQPTTGKKLVEAFEAENPDIKVKVMDIGATDYDTKIPVLLSSGDTSDVITIKSMNIYNSLVEKNQLMPLDDKVKESGVDMAPYQGSDEGIRIDDKLYGLPFRNDYICCITTRLCSIRRVLSIQRTI